MLLIVFVGVSFYTTDKVGRRPLLLGAIGVIIAALLAIGILGSVPLSGSSENALIALACIWVTAYASGIAPIGSIYQGESSTPRLRAKSNSLSQACGQLFGLVCHLHSSSLLTSGRLIFNYCVPLMLSDQQAGWGIQTGFFFAGTASLGAVVLFFIMPEVSCSKSYPY